MDDLDSAPEPVKGEVVYRSIRKTLETVVWCILFFCLGCFCVFWWVMDNLMGRPQSSTHEVTCCGLVFGILALVATPVAAASVLFRLLARERLVIGKECFQVIRRQRGEDVVIVQIPYANVVECSYERHNKAGRIGFDLAVLDDPETYGLGPDPEAYKGSSGWHYTVEGGYGIGLIPIHKKIRKRIRWHGKEDAT